MSHVEIIPIAAPVPALASCEICSHRAQEPRLENGKWVVACSWCTRTRKHELLAGVIDCWNGKPWRGDHGKA